MLQEILSARSVLTMEKTKTPLFLAVKLYQIYNQSEGKSPRTIEWYEHRLGMLKASFGPDFLMGTFEEVMLRMHIADYKTNRQTGEDLLPSIINNHVRALMAFFNRACLDGYTETRLPGRSRGGLLWSVA